MDISDQLRRLIRFIHDCPVPAILCDEDFQTVSCNKSFLSSMPGISPDLRELLNGPTMQRLKIYRESERSTSAIYRIGNFQNRLHISWLRPDEQSEPYMIGLIESHTFADIHNGLSMLYSGINQVEPLVNSLSADACTVLDRMQGDAEGIDPILRNIGTKALLTARYMNDMRECIDIITDRMIPNKCNTDIRPILLAILRKGKEHVRDREISIKFSTVTTPIYAECDIKLITHALSACLNCCLHFAQSKNRITVTLRESDGFILIEFIDPVFGVPANSIEIIQYRNVTSPLNGENVGLYFPYMILQKHGGKLSVRRKKTGGCIISAAIPSLPEHSLYLRDSQPIRYDNIVEHYAELEFLTL